MTNITVTLDQIEKQTISALTGHGAALWIAQEVAKAVKIAEAEDNKVCGLYYLESYCKQLDSGRVDGQIDPEVTLPKSGCVFVDAKYGFAQAAFSVGIDSAIESVKKNGICLFAIAHSHTCTSLGYFTSQIAKRGFLGIGTTNAPACVSPPSGNKPLLGTNPISMSVPSADKDIAFQFDQSTSAIAIGKIRMAAANGESIPEGWAVDKDGNPTTNADKALEGSILSSGGYKGYGFGLMAEVMAAALTGSVSSMYATPLKTVDDEPHNLGQSYILIDPNFNNNKDHFWVQIKQLSDALETQPNARLPGTGKHPVDEVSISKTLWDQVLQLASN